MVAELQALCAHVARNRRLYSQAEEDAVLDVLVHALDLKRGRFVEIGVGSGEENNTRRLAESGWSGTWFDWGQVPCVPHGVHVVRREVTPENVTELLLLHAPAQIDVFSLDIDGNDYWVGLVAIDALRPKIVIVEYNAAWTDPLDIMPYSAHYAWQPGMPFGCSLGAWANALTNYELVYTTHAQVNAFFIRKQ